MREGTSALRARGIGLPEDSRPKSSELGFSSMVSERVLNERSAERSSSRVRRRSPWTAPPGPIDSTDVRSSARVALISAVRDWVDVGGQDAAEFGEGGLDFGEGLAGIGEGGGGFVGGVAELGEGVVERQVLQLGEDRVDLGLQLGEAGGKGGDDVEVAEFAELWRAVHRGRSRDRRRARR